MQTKDHNYNALPDYDAMEEIFFAPKDYQYNPLDEMTEDEMPIPTNNENEEDSILNKEKDIKKISKPLTVVKKDNTQDVEKGKEIFITDVKIRREPSFNIAELTVSEPVKIMKKNQGDRLLKIRITTPVRLSDKKLRKKLDDNFYKVAIYEAESYTELLFTTKGKIGNPYTASDTTGIFKLCVPYQSKESRFALRRGQEIADGLTYYHDRGLSGSGWSDVHILRIEPLSNKIQVLPVLANEGIAQRESLSSMAKKYNAIADGSANGSSI